MQTFKPKNVAPPDDVFMSVDLSISFCVSVCMDMRYDSHIAAMLQRQPYTFFFCSSLPYSLIIDLPWIRLRHTLFNLIGALNKLLAFHWIHTPHTCTTNSEKKTVRATPKYDDGWAFCSHTTATEKERGHQICGVWECGWCKPGRFLCLQSN